VPARRCASTVVPAWISGPEHGARPRLGGTRTARARAEMVIGPFRSRMASQSLTRGFAGRSATSAVLIDQACDGLSAIDPRLWGSESRRRRSSGVAVLVDDAAEDVGAQGSAAFDFVHGDGLLVGAWR
jgi:hypothetical protein